MLTGGLITEYVMIGSQVQWLPVLYVGPICTCYTNRFSLHVHVSLGSIVAITLKIVLQSTYNRWIDEWYE